jgi:hypothetical protein
MGTRRDVTAALISPVPPALRAVEVPMPDLTPAPRAAERRR